MTIKVHVTLKEGVLDPQGQAIADAIRRKGDDFVKDVRVSKVFELTVEGGSGEIRAKIERIAQTLLSNPIIERFTITD